MVEYRLDSVVQYPCSPQLNDLGVGVMVAVYSFFLFVCFLLGLSLIGPSHQQVM